MKEEKTKGLVIRGSRNLFTVRTESGECECRIKGKVLKGSSDCYNPLAPGDIVEIEDGLILGFEKRRNGFSRFNQKGQAPQLIASNVDLVVCVSSTVSPPFRPRFIDRVLLQAEKEAIPAAIVCNKYDLADSASGLDTEERLSDFERIGYPVFRVSALREETLGDFKRFIAGKFSVLFGQSGAGKSSLIKALIPGIEIKTGAINEKFNRGNHTTTQAVMLDVPLLPGAGKTRVIDTPGIRRFAPNGIQPSDLIYYMREFAPLAGKCSYGFSCTHKTEPGCKIIEAVYAGVIHEDRYESFLKIRESLAGNDEYPDND